VISGCVSGKAIVAPTPTQMRPPTQTLIHLTSTPTLRPTQPATLTPQATLESEQAKATLKALLQEPVDCEAPCFWGITPEKTTLEAAKKTFAHLGLNLEFTTSEGGKKFYGVIHDFESGLRITPVLAIQDDVVKNFDVSIIPESQKAGISREWSAYAPETLIKRYGNPSNAVFFIGRGPNSSYIMDMYFERVDLIVEYYSFDIGAELQVCPLINQIYSVRIWMGKNPQYPPPSDLVPLEKATSLTMEEFSKLVTGNPNNACFNLKGEMFP